MSNINKFHLLYKDSSLHDYYLSIKCEKKEYRLRKKKRIDNKTSIDNYHFEIKKIRCLLMLFFPYDRVKMFVTILNEFFWQPKGKFILSYFQKDSKLPYIR